MPPMVRASIALSLLLLACGDNNAGPRLDGHGRDAPVGDAAPGTDAPLVDAATVDAPGTDAVGAYRHTIAIDGADDFTAGELFTTTSSPSFGARVTWDAQYLYVGYKGPDLATTTSDASQKWLFVYVDTDPAAATGATTSVLYNSQRATFPTGFGAEFYYRNKSDGTFASLEQHGAGGAWSTVATTVNAARNGDYLEVAIPRAALGASTKLGVVTWMINEKNMAEGSYAGLYTGNFTDGYAVNLALTKYLIVDLASTATPNDPANEGP